MIRTSTPLSTPLMFGSNVAVPEEITAATTRAHLSVQGRHFLLLIRPSNCNTFLSPTLPSPHLSHKLQNIYQADVSFAVSVTPTSTPLPLPTPTLSSVSYRHFLLSFRPMLWSPFYCLNRKLLNKVRSVHFSFEVFESFNSVRDPLMCSRAQVRVHRTVHRDRFLINWYPLRIVQFGGNNYGVIHEQSFYRKRACYTWSDGRGSCKRFIN